MAFIIFDEWRIKLFFARCGNDLSTVEGSVIEIRQVFDMPMLVRPGVTEHQVISKKCCRGHCCQVDFPKEVCSRVLYETNIRAW